MLRIAFREGKVAEGTGEATSASEEPQEVSNGGSARQEVF